MANAHTEFQRTMDRAEDLLERHRAEPAHSTADDQVRMAVVLGVAAMDSYFTTKFCNILVPYLKTKGPTDGLTKVLSQAGLDTETALILLSMQRPYRRIRTLVERSFDTLTTQRTDVIDELFLSFGLKEFCKNSQKLMHRNNLVLRVEKLVSRRHQIVHEGDLNGRSQARSINIDQVASQLSDLRLFVAGAERLIANSIK